MSKLELVLGVEEIKEISNFAHWIPICHGYTQEFMAERYPGWNWNDLIPRLLNKGYVTTTRKKGSVKLWQNLWLNEGIDSIKATKDGLAINFEILRDKSRSDS